MRNPNAVHLPSRFAYIPIPKAACTSIRQAIKAAVTRPAIKMMTNDELAEVVTGRWIVATVVRHPLERLVSCWANRIERDDVAAGMRSYGLEPWDSFERLAEVAIATSDAEANQHWESQTSLLSTTSGDLLPTWIGRFERLADDYAELAAMLRKRGVELPALEHWNRSDHAEWKQHYTPELERRVRERYAADFDAWYPGE